MQIQNEKQVYFCNQYNYDLRSIADREEQLRQLDKAKKEREKKIRQKEIELEKERKRLAFEERQRDMLVLGDDVEDKSFLTRAPHT